MGLYLEKVKIVVLLAGVPLILGARKDVVNGCSGAQTMLAAESLERYIELNTIDPTTAISALEKLSSRAKQIHFSADGINYTFYVVNQDTFADSASSDLINFARLLQVLAPVTKNATRTERFMSSLVSFSKRRFHPSIWFSGFPRIQRVGNISRGLGAIGGVLLGAVSAGATIGEQYYQVSFIQATAGVISGGVVGGGVGILATYLPTKVFYLLGNCVLSVMDRATKKFLFPERGHIERSLNELETEGSKHIQGLIIAPNSIGVERYVEEINKLIPTETTRDLIVRPKDEETP